MHSLSPSLLLKPLAQLWPLLSPQPALKLPLQVCDSADLVPVVYLYSAADLKWAHFKSAAE